MGMAPAALGSSASPVLGLTRATACVSTVSAPSVRWMLSILTSASAASLVVTKLMGAFW